MDHSKLFLLLPMAFMALSSCGNKTPSSEESSSSSSEKDALSVMEAFQKKIEQGNYYLHSPNALSIGVYDNNKVVYIDYEEVDTHDHAFMTVNENETYTCECLHDSIVEDSLKYFGEGDASDLVDEQLLSYWFHANENVWDTFTSYGEDYYKFLVVDENVRKQILNKFAMIPEYSFSIINEVHLLIDPNNEDKATIDISFHSQRDHIQLTIDLNPNKPSLPFNAWYEDENRAYPEAPTIWPSNIVTEFIIVFDQRYQMEKVMPFPSFASRTFHNDPYLTQYENIIYIRDTLASEEQMKEYIDVLLNESDYEEVADASLNAEGIRRFDLLLSCYQEIYFSYATVYIEYDEGVTITYQKSFNTIVYQGREAINSFLEKTEFLPLPKSPCLSSFKAYDRTLDQNEGVNFITPYALAIELEIACSDFDQAEAYMDAYNEECAKIGYVMDQDSELHHQSYSSEAYGNTIDYLFSPQEGLLRMFFRHREYYTDEQMAQNLLDINMIDLRLDEFSSISKDQTIFYQIMYALFHKVVYDITITFDSYESKTAYLTDLISKMEADGFLYYENPLEIKVARKSDAYYQEEKGLILAYNDDTSALLNMNVIHVGDDFSPLH